MFYYFDLVGQEARKNFPAEGTEERPEPRSLCRSLSDAALRAERINGRGLGSGPSPFPLDFEFTPGHRKQLLSACRIRGQPGKTRAVRSIKCCQVPVASGYSNVVLLSRLTLRQSHKGVNSTVSDKPASSPFPLTPSFSKYLMSDT